MAASTRPQESADESWMTSGAGHPRRWAVLAWLVVSLLIVVLDNTVLNIALPIIQKDLDASQGELVWAIDSYILVFAALLFTWGVIGDRIGRKRVLVIGLITFAVASAFCAFSVSSGMLIASRAVMGVGGAAVMPTTLAIITVVFPPHERGKAIGMWAGAVGAAVALGPVLGGLLLQNPSWTDWLTGNDWGSVFLINVPIVIIGLIGILRVVPETRNPSPRKLDIRGVVISAAGLGLLVYGIIHASSTRNWLDLGVILPSLAGIALLVIFVLLERRSDHPSFDVSLFRNRGYAVSLAAVTLGFFALSGITFVLPFYFQIIRGFDVLIAGVCFVPFAVGQILAAPRSAAMVKRFGYRLVMTSGLAIVAAALAAMAFIEVQTPLWVLLLIFFAFGFGMGNVIAPGSTVMQNVLPLARAGAGSAVQNTVRQVGGALGVAIVGTVLATQYAQNLTAALPAAFPAPLADAAKQSLVATDAILDRVAQQGLPVPAVDALRNGAYDAFLQAAHVTTLIALAVAVIAALIVGFGLPYITPPTRQVEKGKAPAPVDAADELVIREAQSYRQEAAAEIVPGTDRE